MRQCLLQPCKCLHVIRAVYRQTPPWLTYADVRVRSSGLPLGVLADYLSISAGTYDAKTRSVRALGQYFTPVLAVGGLHMYFFFCVVADSQEVALTGVSNVICVSLTLDLHMKTSQLSTISSAAGTKRPCCFTAFSKNST